MNDLTVLDKHRDALLLAEIAAWLHMFGKLQEEFLEGDVRLDTKIPIDTPEKLSELLLGNWTGIIWNTLPVPDLQAEELSISSLIKEHRKRWENKDKGFIKLIKDAHGRGSGIEKGVINRFLRPHKNPVYLSTALGYETDINYTDIKQAQQDLYDFLQKQLESLKGSGTKLSYDEWSNVQKAFVERVHQYFSITVAETRRPLNDVTLFDQTAMSVAFFKAALAQNLLMGKWQESAQDEVANRYHWCLLRVGVDGMAFWGNATRVGDLLTRKELIKDALDKVQQLLEVEYPLGTEVYRDENGSVFIVPDIADLLTCTDGSQPLKQCIQAIADTEFSNETRFTLFISERTRDASLFGKLVKEKLPKPAPQFTWLQSQWQERERDICPICGLRPQGPGSKAWRRNVCDVCEKRRVDRSAQWIKAPATTIWSDEVADSHGRLALIAAHFEIDNWLDGSAFNTILSFDPKSRQISTEPEKGPPEVYEFALHVLTKDIEEGLGSNRRFETNLLGNLVQKNARGDSDFVRKFYELRVGNTDLGAISSSRDPELLALSLIRQPPSFARIRRTWQTTRAFWEEIVADLNNSVGKVSPRIKLRGSFISAVSDVKTLAVTHTYELKLGAIHLSITCTKENEFLTVENLQRIAILLDAPKESTETYAALATYVCNQIQSEKKAGRGFKIEEPTGYSRSNRTLGELKITEIFLEQGSSYVPAIPILTEPRTFMALVPADKALNVAQAIKKKYEKEIGKVRNRLPLAMGIVFSDRRTPLPAILDAGRRMLKQPVQEEGWVIDQKVGNIGSKEVVLSLKRNDCYLRIEVPAVMGDGATVDSWYPYWHVESDKDGNKPVGRNRQFTGLHSKEWVHVCDLLVGDTVHLSPSRFDFELLDTAARRFEVSYDEDGKRRGRLRPARPYYLEQFGDFEQLWTMLSDRLATSQIDNLIGLIEMKRQEWLAQQDDSIFQTAVRNILNNANWQRSLSAEDLPRLARAAACGQLTDVVELYVTILKRKTSVDWMGGTK